MKRHVVTADVLDGHASYPQLSVNSVVRAMLIMYVRCELDLGHIAIIN